MTLKYQQLFVRCKWNSTNTDNMSALFNFITVITSLI